MIPTSRIQPLYEQNSPICKLELPVNYRSMKDSPVISGTLRAELLPADSAIGMKHGVCSRFAGCDYLVQFLLESPSGTFEPAVLANGKWRSDIKSEHHIPLGLLQQAASDIRAQLPPDKAYVFDGHGYQRPQTKRT